MNNKCTNLNQKIDPLENQKTKINKKEDKILTPSLKSVKVKETQNMSSFQKVNKRGRKKSTQSKLDNRNKQFKRVPLKEQNVLGHIPHESGYHYRLVIDKKDRIRNFQQAGYEIVEDALVNEDCRSQTPSQVGSLAAQSAGNGETYYCMRIKSEWYEADQLAKQKDLDELFQNNINSLQNIPNNRSYRKDDHTYGHSLKKEE